MQMVKCACLCSALIREDIRGILSPQRFCRLAQWRCIMGDYTVIVLLSQVVESIAWCIMIGNEVPGHPWFNEPGYAGSFALAISVAEIVRCRWI